MEKCFQMSIVRAGVSVIHQTRSHCCSTKTLAAPTKPTALTPSSSIRSFNRRGGRLIAYNYSISEVEVVTACSWTNLVVAADVPVLVEFWAPGCETCQVVDEVAKEYNGKALCYKLNIDDYPNVALQYGITSIPSVLFYKNGENKEIITGDISKSTLCATLEKNRVFGAYVRAIGKFAAFVTLKLCVQDMENNLLHKVYKSCVYYSASRSDPFVDPT